jgi:ATP-dependent RNA helicase RhlE
VNLPNKRTLRSRSWAGKTGLRSLTVYGGVSAQPQIKNLRAGAEIAVACPGRLLDLMDQKVLSLRDIEFLVLDEADQMFDMGFLPAIRRILKALPTTRQTLLFSATMPPEIRALANDFLHDPVSIDVGVSQPLDTVKHAIYPSTRPRKWMRW